MNLDIIPNGAIKRVHVSQNDVGRTLTFELFNNSTSYTVPSGATVKIQGTKPSGFGFSETCAVSGNTATIDTTEAMTDESGNIQTELSISYDDVVIGTSNFVLAVEKNPHPSNTTDGTQITAQSLEVRIEALEEAIESGGSGLTDGAKQALLNCFAHVAWIDEYGQDYYDDLYEALYPPANLVSISAVYSGGAVVASTDINDLRSDLVVTAHYDNGTTQTVTSYTLSGTLTVGASTITVTYGGKTTTFTVAVEPHAVLYSLANTPVIVENKGDLSEDTGLEWGVVDGTAMDDWTLLVDAVYKTQWTARNIFEVNNSTDTRGFAFGVTGGGVSRFYVGTTSFSTPSVVTDWKTKFAVTHSSGVTNKVTVHVLVDGDVESTEVTGSISIPTPRYAGNVYCGGIDSTQGFSGTINTFTIYSEVLSANEIADFLNGGE